MNKPLNTLVISAPLGAAPSVVKNTTTPPHHQTTRAPLGAVCEIKPNTSFLKIIDDLSFCNQIKHTKIIEETTIYP